MRIPKLALGFVVGGALVPLVFAAGSVAAAVVRMERRPC
jgi:hypothetical protein